MSIEEIYQVESSQRQHFDVLHHEEKMITLCIEQEYTRFAMLKPRIFQDGNQWCVLLGENIQEGICGFGPTPHEAVLDFDKQWRLPIEKGGSNA